jgi:hypothetical protein
LAEQRGVDVLLIANVTFKVYGVNRTVDANLALRLVDVAGERAGFLWTSKTLSSNQVKAALNRGQDPTRDVIRSFTEYLEVNCHLQDKPALDAAKVRQRIESLVKQESNPLPALVEVRYYQLKGALTPHQAEQYYQRLLDAESGSVLAGGSAEDRRRVIERFLPRSAL